MKALRSLFAALAIFLLPVTTPAVTTRLVTSMPTVEQAAIAYDAGSVRVVSDDALTGTNTSQCSVPSFDPVVGLGAAKTAPEIMEGTKVYRVWGGKSGPWGESWTTVNRNTVPNLRSAAGLPDANAGRFVSEGILQSTEGVTSRGALIVKSGQQGGLPEVVIKGAEQKVLLQRVSGVNPEF